MRTCVSPGKMTDMVEVNWKGIARTAKALGGEGTNVLLLKSKRQVDPRVLEAATPTDGDSPANGGWTAAPTGWMLLVEGLDAQLTPWIDNLAAQLSRAGISGELTGANAAAPPTWAQGDWDSRGLRASVGYRPRSGFPAAGWRSSNAALIATVDLGVRWVSTTGAKIAVSTAAGASFWASPTVAAQQLLNTGRSLGHGFATGYDRGRLEIRHASVGHASASLAWEAADHRWREAVAELTDLVRALPLEHVTIAKVSHRNLEYLAEGRSPAERAYRHHPERWDQFVLEPAGIQVLTNRHLEAAKDLSEWTSTRLDHDHVLVEARDLEPWYAVRRRPHEGVEADLMRQACHDFGDMVLTDARAAELGLTP